MKNNKMLKNILLAALIMLTQVVHSDAQLAFGFATLGDAKIALTEAESKSGYFLYNGKYYQINIHTGVGQFVYAKNAEQALQPLVLTRLKEAEQSRLALAQSLPAQVAQNNALVVHSAEVAAPSSTTNSWLRNVLQGYCSRVQKAIGGTANRIGSMPQSAVNFVHNKVWGYVLWPEASSTASAGKVVNLDTAMRRLNQNMGAALASKKLDLSHQAQYLAAMSELPVASKFPTASKFAQAAAYMNPKRAAMAVATITVAGGSAYGYQNNYFNQSEIVAPTVTSENKLTKWQRVQQACSGAYNSTLSTVQEHKIATSVVIGVMVGLFVTHRYGERLFGYAVAVQPENKQPVKKITKRGHVA